MRCLALVALTLVAGCDLYFSDGDDEPPCAAYDLAPAQELRNPQTGMCEGIGYPCDGACGPCTADAIAQPDWGSCYSMCEQLSEHSCMVTAGCRVAYRDFPTQDRLPEFLGCWATAMSGPIQGGGCSNLDAHACSRHDDCAAYYIDQTNALQGNEFPMEFWACGPEPIGAACASDQECGPNQRCTAGEEECNSPPGCGNGQACPAVCYGHCVPDNSCANVDCGPNAHCEQQCHPCDGTMGPCDPQCQPMCVPNTNGCLAADCAPGYECVEVCTDGMPGNPNCGECTIQCVPSTACEALQTEAACSGRADCTPVYQGDDCTCYPGYCQCNVLTYDRCQTN
ncbi:MAG: hypothetical protein H0T89_19505 [Deltaproteobacteria bacterium]|nr:hypothetical protein [Deltaproteobacteria bacterium]MDQ3295796.1 hypothetical protein [Myxococcota bacterium]